MKFSHVFKFLPVVLTGSALLSACQTTSLPAVPQARLQLPAVQAPVLKAQQPKQILVKFLSTTTSSDKALFHTEFNLRTVKVIANINLHVMETLPGVLPVRFSTLQADERVEYIETNGKVVVNPLRGSQPSNQKFNSFQRLVGKKIRLQGIYSTTRSGAHIYLDNGEQLSLVDHNGNILYHLPQIEDQRTVTINGVIAPTKGQSSNQSLGIYPLQVTQK